MPVIVRLQYCVIRMYFNEHNPPHFHVDTTNGRVLMTIEDLEVIEGEADARAVREARVWARENRERLWAFWREHHR